jgi:hypothetical protein
MGVRRTRRSQHQGPRSIACSDNKQPCETSARRVRNNAMPGTTHLMRQDPHRNKTEPHTDDITWTRSQGCGASPTEDQKAAQVASE